MIIQQYTSEQIELARKFLSPDAFMYIICNAIATGKPLSAVGFGDGERAVMQYYKGSLKTSYLNDLKYLNEYGLTGANLKSIGENLFKAANEAHYFCPLIHGIYVNTYDVIRLCDPRNIYVERLFPYAWFYMGREKELMKHNGVTIVCRHSGSVSLNLEKKYKTQIQNIEYSSWQDYDKALSEIGETKSNLILCAVGQSGKYLIVEAANKFNKVVLDIGSALINKWQN